jgi:Ca2+/Na+ antiporter
MTAKDHNNLLGIFFYVAAGFMAFFGILLPLIYLIVGTAIFIWSNKEEDKVASIVLIAVSIVVAVIFIGISAFYFATGRKMRRLSPSGRIFGIIASILALFYFPLGTALGVYGLWFLFGEDGKNFYHSLASGNYPNSGGYLPPQPGSWQ